MNLLPLLPHFDADKVLAWRDRQPVTQAEFMADVLALGPRLPAGGHVFNLCKDRYWFAVALFASISRGAISLLQNSTAPQNMAALFADYPDAVCVGEHSQPQLAQIPFVPVSSQQAAPIGPGFAMPHIGSMQPIARIFTSGSTGTPQAHTLRFGRMLRCAVAEAKRMWEVVGQPCVVLGTVPPQHMFGLEATVLLPIYGGGQLSAEQPFFAADVSSALQALPLPRLLVSTPFHLRKLMQTELPMPAVSAVLSATAPLALDLAQEVEARLQAPMVEIYGSTETGAIATRRPTQGVEWDTYEGMTVVVTGQEVRVHAAHFDAPQPLNDSVELLSPTRFRLLGRNADMINIVGKRNSLGFLNQLLQRLPCVEDGVFVLHENEHDKDSARLVAFVVAKERNSAAIVAALREHVDPVFLPRPVVFVEALARDANGKLPAAAVSALLAKHLPAKA